MERARAISGGIPGVVVSAPTIKQKQKPSNPLIKTTMKKLLTTLCLAAMPLAGAHAADQYWRTDNSSASWTTSNWAASDAGPFTTAWSSGSDVFFTADSTITFATTTVGNVTLSDDVDVNVTSGGTLTLGGVRTFDIGDGATLTWTSQSQSTASGNEGAGIIKDGAGTLNWGAGPGTSNARFNGGFTLNEGAVIVSGNGSFGTGVLTINGGTIQSSGTRTFTSSSVVIGGDFAIAGTGDWNMDMDVSLGGAVRTIDMDATGTKTWNGTVSGVGGGLTFNASNTGTHVFTGANNYTGGTTVNSGTLIIANNSGLGAASGDAALAGSGEAVLRFNAGTTVDNNLVYSNSNVASRVEVVVADTANFRTGTTGTLASQLGGVNTGAQILEGSNSFGSDVTLQMSFSTLSPALNDLERLSDVFSLSGTGLDVFVLQLNVTGLLDTATIGWLDGTQTWVNAIDENSGTGFLGGIFYQSSFSAFVGDNGGVFNPTTMLGAYGNDGNGNVWAVLDHNSDFAAVPEPSTWVLLGIGAMALIARRKFALKA